MPSPLALLATVYFCTQIIEGVEPPPAPDYLVCQYVWSDVYETFNQDLPIPEEHETEAEWRLRMQMDRAALQLNYMAFYDNNIDSIRDRVQRDVETYFLSNRSAWSFIKKYHDGELE